MLSYNTPSPLLPTFVFPDDYIINPSDSTCSSPEPRVCAYHTEPLIPIDSRAMAQYFTASASSPSLSVESLTPQARSTYEQDRHDEMLRSVLKLEDLPLDLRALPMRFPRERARQKGDFLRYPVIHIISLSIRGSPRQALTLNQIYEAVEENLVEYQPVPGETAKERAERTKWRSSVRHSLSLQCMFERVNYLSGDTDEKRRGDYWTVDPFKYGQNRRTMLLEEKKKATAVATLKKKRSSTAKRSSPAKPRLRGCIRASPSPQPQLQAPPVSEDQITLFDESDPLFIYTHLPGPSITHPRDVDDLPPITLPFIYPIPAFFTSMPSDALQAVVYQEPTLDPYFQYSSTGHYQELGQYNPYNSPMSMPIATQQEHQAEQGISPYLLHAPVPSQAQERPPVAVVHGRALRSTASRKRRNTLSSC